MKNTTFPDYSVHKQSWLPPTEMGEQKESRPSRLVQWWYDLTSIPEAPANASFVKREAARKGHLFSTVLFFYTLVIIVFLPICLLLTNHYDFWLDAGLIVLSFVALGVNRQGNTLAAGVLIVSAYELVLIIIIFTTTPFDEPSIQIYDLFIMTELLAVSLLPPQCVFIVATINATVILTSLLYEPHMLILAKDLETQFMPIMIRPVSLQFIIAGVAYVWVYSTSKAIARADRAEMVAMLEHALVEQKRGLEVGIEQILQTHVAVANGDLNARAPLSQDSVLWQIARALNTLLVRLQRTSLAERELHRVEQAVAQSVNVIQQAEQRQQLPRLTFTHTALDPLVAALQGKTLAYTPPTFMRSKNGRNTMSDSVPSSYP